MNAGSVPPINMFGVQQSMVHNQQQDLFQKQQHQAQYMPVHQLLPNQNRLHTQQYMVHPNSQPHSPLVPQYFLDQRDNRQYIRRPVTSAIH